MIIRNNAYKLRQIADTYILVACKQNTTGKWLYTLNDCSAIIWKLCKEPIFPHLLIESLSKHFGGSIPEEQHPLLENFIESLLQENLLLEV